MRLAPLLLLIALLGASPARAQGNEIRRPALGTYDVIALRVEFQPDTTRFTTGDGTFDGDLYSGLTPSIDPLPHDAGYFQAHLDFLSSYVAHVSDGAAEVRTHLLPEIVRVSGQMGEYAPTGPDAGAPGQLVHLARLIDESWTLADQQIQFSVGGLDPERTAFLIFHAGVGRDVELTGTTLDRTPEDLPSLFFGADALRDLLPDAQISFKGLPLDHSLILPRTETRRGVNFITDEPFLAEISINGMIAASFFNFLGVPDLFDTATGQSAIGPYGLMDPLGIFSYAGLFPPEPSAWTKYYLGWADPLELRGADSILVSLDSNSLFRTSDMARVWISESEYFLVENRQRDPEDDDLHLTVRIDGELRDVAIENGAEGFSGSDVSAFPGGVVVAVDNYDWALPGGLDESGNELVGGILIWHIDERVIERELNENAVNSNPERRGIDLEEADSGQDLGFPSENPFAPQADLGSPFDFWYEGNPVRVVNQIGQELALYKNRFGPDTFPSSDASDGGESFIVLEGFTPPGAEMSFTYRRVESESIAPVALGFAEALQSTLAGRDVRPDAASVWQQDGRTIVDVRDAGGDWTIVLAGPGNDVETFEALTPSSRFEDRLIWVEDTGSGPQFAVFDPATMDRTTFAMADAGEEIVGPVVVSGSSASALVSTDGSAVLYQLNAGAVTRIDLPEVGAPLGLTSSKEAGLPDASLVVFGRNGAVVTDGPEQWTFALQLGETVGEPLFGEDDAGVLGVLPLPDRDAMLVLSRGGESREVSIAHAAGFSWTSLADATGDGQLEILVGGDSVLNGYTRSGAVAAGFPIALGADASGATAIARDAESRVFLFVPLASGTVVGFVREGANFRRIEGFPLPVGAMPVSLSLTMAEDEADAILYAMSATRSLYAWRIKQPVEPVWSGPYGDTRRSSFVRAPSSIEEPTASSPSLLVENETYNWPNPIRDGTTFLRCVTTVDSRIHITIIDGAGALVEEITIESVRAGVPTEVAWETNASSGLYFARVTARSVTGREETRVIKMAVIR